MKTIHLALGLGTVFVIGVVVVIMVRLNLPSEDTPTAKLDVEIAKAALSGCIVAVVGAVIAALVKAREQSVQEARLRADVLGQFLQQLGEIYRSVKAARRQLRSLGLTAYFGTPPESLTRGQLKAYEDEMKAIEKSQLSLENLKLQVRLLPPFGDICYVAGHLRTMENYLRVLLKEREAVAPMIRRNDPVPFANLVRLQEFTESTDAPSPVPIGQENYRYRFGTEFADAYDNILESISRNLKTLAAA